MKLDGLDDLVEVSDDLSESTTDTTSVINTTIISDTIQTTQIEMDELDDLVDVSQDLNEIESTTNIASVVSTSAAIHLNTTAPGIIDTSTMATSATSSEDLAESESTTQTISDNSATTEEPFTTATTISHDMTDTGCVSGGTMIIVEHVDSKP